jgi:MerR family copper efflux transcriptional regulator
VERQLSISETSASTGLSPDTLRYYERIGLLTRVARNAGGQRRYTSGDVARLRFIRRAQAMDFSLGEISQLLALRDLDGDVRADVRGLAANKLAAIESRIAALSTLRDELAGLIAACHASEHKCPIIGQIDDAGCNATSTGGQS